MNYRAFLAVVPKPMRTIALIAPFVTVTAGIVVAMLNSHPPELLVNLALFSLGGLVGGAFLATWMLFVGYVFADARRRGMRATLWTLVVIAFPHLLGFLLYFVMRQPVTSACSQCHMAIAQGQRYCSWCGAAQPSEVDTGISPPWNQPRNVNG